MESLISYFDEIAPIWDNANVYNKTYIRDIIKFSEMKDGDVVLDVGSGPGILVDFIREINKSGKIVEIDISQKMLNMARAKNYSDGNIVFLKEDVENYSFDLEVDVVFLFNCLPYLKRKAEVVKSLCIKNLVKGGRFVIFHNRGEEQTNSSLACGDKRICDAKLPEFNSFVSQIYTNIVDIQYKSNTLNEYAVILKKR